MISGIGVDICSVDRIAELIERRPKVVQKLLDLDVSTMTPLEAITALWQLQKEAQDHNG